MSILLRLGEAIFGTNEDLMLINDGEGGEGTDGEGKDGDESGKGKDGEEGEGKDGKGGGDNDADQPDCPEDGKDGKDGKGKGKPGNEFSGEIGESDQTSSTEHSTGAGGHCDSGSARDDRAIAQALLQAIENNEDSGLADNNGALGNALEELRDKDQDCEAGERPWRPYDREFDTVELVQTRSGDKDVARRISNSVKKEVAAIRSRLRSKFLQNRAPRTIHGVQNGRGLSERRLVQSMVEVRAGSRPTRPDYTKVRKPDCSLAVAIVLDESGSMSSHLGDASRAMAAIAEPLDAVGAPVMALGFRDGGGRNHPSHDEMYDSNGQMIFHRYSGIRIDVFKQWDEKWRKVMPRIARTRATGGTPMSDGIQYALQGLSDRTERHRVMLVITDGYPNGGHAEVMRRQIRIAREAGIAIVGIGIDGGCEAVGHHFDLSVQCHTLSELPKKLLDVLEEIVFPSQSKAATFDGKMKQLKGRRKTA